MPASVRPWRTPRCRAIHHDTFEIFGITAISGEQAFGANVWEPRGLVEFLPERKQVGRILAIFKNKKSAPEQLRTTLDRDVFNALLLTDNRLVHHLPTSRAENTAILPDRSNQSARIRAA